MARVEERYEELRRKREQMAQEIRDDMGRAKELRKKLEQMGRFGLVDRLRMSVLEFLARATLRREGK